MGELRESWGELEGEIDIMAHDYEHNNYIYHITSLKNMESILRYGLIPRDKLTEEMLKDDIADSSIISYREQYGITQYVPFHFFPGNPFAWRVQQMHPKERFVYIALRREYARTSQFKIIPLHPMSEEQKFAPEIFDYDEGMVKIEWDVMNARDFKDPHGKHVCLAECVCNQIIPIEYLIRRRRVIFFVKSNLDRNSLLDIHRKVYPQSVNVPYCIVDQRYFA